jgi:hypothetical protein
MEKVSQNTSCYLSMLRGSQTLIQAGISMPMGQIVKSKRAAGVMIDRIGSRIRGRQTVSFIMLTPTLKTLVHF